MGKGNFLTSQTAETLLVNNPNYSGEILDDVLTEINDRIDAVDTSSVKRVWTAWFRGERNDWLDLWIEPDD